MREETQPAYFEGSVSWGRTYMSKKKIVAGVLAVAFASSFLTLAGLSWLLGFRGSGIDDIARFALAVHFIEKKYVSAIEPSKLMDGAITGMLQVLGDPHSIYMGPQLYQQLMDQTEGTFGGIGVYMGFKESKVSVISVMEGSPAEQAGLAANDEILAVDGVPVAEIQPGEVAFRIRGEIGTEVKLLVHREGETDREVSVTRGEIQLKTAAGQMMEDGIGYIRISSFAENTGVEFSEALTKLEQEGMQGLVIDLRQNPGGLLTTCVEIADQVVPKGLVVSIVDRDGNKEEYLSELEEERCPMAVLIDENSASASEILAGALQDREAATIIGTKSYGKGSVQTVVPLFHSDAMKLTVAKYYTPSGRCIDGVGVKPDIEIPLTEEDTADVQLRKAMEVLKEKTAK